MQINYKAFSLTELMVAVFILTILSTLGFIYYGTYNAKARDVQRKSDISRITSALKLFKQSNASIPLPGESFDINNDGLLLVKQGKLNNQVLLDTLDAIPLDPTTKQPYIFSVRLNNWSNGSEDFNGIREFQVAATLENEGISTAIVDGDYKTVSKGNLPTIITTASSTTNSLSNLQFVFNNQAHNLAYTLSPDSNGNYPGKSDGSSSGSIINELGNKYWINSNYGSCDEIKQDGKLLSPTNQDLYQIVQNGNLIDMSCP